MKKRIIVLLSLAVLLLTAGIAEAAMATRQISAVYQNMKLYVNGAAVSVLPDEEPFIYNGRTFVPIRVVAEALNQEVEWNDATKSVNITGASTSADANLLAQKDIEIQSLKQQLAQKDTEIQSLNNTITTLQADNNSSDDAIKDLEDDLLADYDELEDVEIDDIILDGDEDDVDVDVEVDLGEFDDEWDDLTDSDIENWLEDVAADIQEALSEDTKVSGTITDIDKDDVLIEFTKDGDDDLEIDNATADADDVEEDLDGEEYSVGSIDFTIDYISYDEDDDEVTINLDTDENNASSAWTNLSTTTIYNDVENICEDIADIFDEDAGISLDYIDIRFYGENNNSLGSYEYDVEDGDLND